MGLLKFSSLALALPLVLSACSIDDDDLLICLNFPDALSSFQKDFGSYDFGDSLTFVHSNGYEFQMAVVQDNVHYRAGYGDYPNESSIPCNSETSRTGSTRLRDVIVESDYPMLSIHLSMDGDNDGPQNISVNIGRNQFVLDESDFKEKNNPFTGEITAPIESMVVNGKKYKNVAVVSAQAPSSAKIYYTIKKGFIKIEFDDGTYITRKE